MTDQVEVQGEKIRDLEMCLEEHREKLNSTEEMLQQVIDVGPYLKPSILRSNNNTIAWIL